MTPSQSTKHHPPTCLHDSPAPCGHRLATVWGFRLRTRFAMALATLLWLQLFLLCPGAHAEQSFKAGDRVEVDIIMAGAEDRAMWKTGTVSRIENGEYVIRLDNGEERSMPIRLDKHWVRASQTAAPKKPDPMPAKADKNGSTPPQGRPPGPGATGQKPQSPPDAESDPALKPPGLGAPPSGVYKSQKIGQTYGGMGSLEIRGKTYRGLGDEGKFQPFTVETDGQIKWSAGIAGLPDGWTIRSSFYAGKDSLGRPMIKIYYRSKAGWNDLLDCIME